MYIFIELYCKHFYFAHATVFFFFSPQDTPSILDWPLPQPAYDEVTADLDDQSGDQEVRAINRGLTEEASGTLASSVVGRSETQSADLFQELQREVELQPHETIYFTAL